MKAYKLVFAAPNFREIYQPCTVSLLSARSNLDVLYRPDRKVIFDESYPGFAFKKLKHARKFVENHRPSEEEIGEYEIWKCEVDYLRDAKEIADDSSDIDNIRNFWQGNCHCCNIVAAPEGSILCSSIKLTERMRIHPMLGIKDILFIASLVGFVISVIVFTIYSSIVLNSTAHGWGL